MTRHLAYAPLLGVALLLSAACEHSKTAPFTEEFAVELPPQAASDNDVSRNEYVVVSDRGLVSTELSGDSLRPLPGSGPRIGPSVTIKLDFMVHRGSVVTTAYTLPPESDPFRYSDGHKRRLGVHSARLNETVELQELKRLGYEPYTFRIVSARPEHPSHPAIVSRVPSIQARIFDEDRQGYTLLLRNISSRDVVSYTIAQGSGSSRETVSRRQPLIASGAERNERIVTPSQEIVIAGALFSDGSHEGESDIAAQLKSGQIGHEIQERRAAPIIDRIIRDSTLDDNARVAKIKDELTKLSNKPDDGAIRAMQSQFPDLPAKVILDDLTHALYSARVEIWSEVYGYVHSSGEYPPPIQPPPLTEWLRRR